jgi:signal transduction histidine kinase
VAVALSLVMAVGLSLPARWFGWEEMWLASSLRDLGFVTLLLLATGPGYWLARGGVRLWLGWNRLRQQRMVWALTHAQLTVAAVVAVTGALVTFLMAFAIAGQPALPPETSGVFATLAERLLRTIIPALMVIGLMIAVALAVLLPPAALVSLLVAHRTTRRLERLAAAARALRQGAYEARVEVAGEDEVAQLQADFNAMAADLERTLRDLEVQHDTVARLLESRRDLVAKVSHELRTPVATVRATLESALARWPDTPADDLHRDLGVMEGEIVRLQGLIDDLFTLSRSDAGGLALEIRPVDVAPLVQRMVDAQGPLAWSSGRVELMADLPAELPRVRADEARLAQILSNLVHNGVRHTPPGGIVAVMVAVDSASCPSPLGTPESIRIEVKDTGEGIAADDLASIWERFYRGEGTSLGERTGAGLGLALVKELTEAMGGTVGVESTVGEGSCFTVWLPSA